MKQWTEINMSFSRMQEKGLITAGTFIRLDSGKEFLIGDINLIGGACDCCPAVRYDNIVKYYRKLDEPA